MSELLLDHEQCIYPHFTVSIDDTRDGLFAGMEFYFMLQNGVIILFCIEFWEGLELQLFLYDLLSKSNAEVKQSSTNHLDNHITDETRSRQGGKQHE